MNHLIVMDNVSGIADNYKKLTVVVLTKTVWEDIELKLMIQKNRFAILINPVMMSYTMFS